MPTEVRVCGDCDQAIDDLETFSMYECPDCGDQFSQEDTGTHRSECCGKFSSKVFETHEGCQGDNEGAEQKWQCDNECGEFHETVEEADKCDKEALDEPESEDSDELGAYRCKACGKAYVAIDGGIGMEDAAWLCHRDYGNVELLASVPVLTPEQLKVIEKDGWVVVENPTWKWKNGGLYTKPEEQ